MTITIFKFLSRYYGVPVNEHTYLTHKLAKRKYQFLKRCSFEHARTNPKLVSTGKIIYVTDSTKEAIPYICPKVIDTYGADCEYTSRKKKQRQRIVLEELGDMPTHVLRELLSEYKYQLLFYTSIKEELMRRGVYENKKYKLRKENLELEEGGCNDKYQRRREIKCKKS